MVDTGKQPVGWPGTVSEKAASFPIATALKHVDDEDEWEYEYSATETETYYLTMDLSHSGMFDKVKDTFHTQTRGGYRQWFNPVYADPNKNTRLRPTKTNAMLFDDEDDGDDVAPAEGDDDAEEEGAKGAANSTMTNGRRDEEGIMNPAAAQRASSRPPSRAASRAPSAAPQLQPPRLKNVGEIQVLDLHANNPIISYKGRIFSGSWARNIGTELVFGAHDDVAERGLPYLRALPGGVDLMAASSARILTTPADLRLKAPHDGSNTLSSRSGVNPSRRQGPDRYKWMRHNAGIEIPITFDKHGRRKPQARFLENLMAIKHSKGEKDKVTTITKDTLKDYVNREDDPEEATMQKKRARDRKRQKRLMEERAMQPKKPRSGGNRWAKKIVTFADQEPSDDEDEDDDDDDDDEEGGGGEGDPSTLSAKTPASWTDLDASRKH